MGMTDNQYKGKLLDELQAWQKVRKMAIAADNKEIIEFVEEQIALINEKLKF